MDIEKDAFLKTVLYLLSETFEGSPEGRPSAYLDRGTGFFSTLEAVSADEASRAVGGATVAAQTEHAKFYLDRFCEFMQGRTEPVKWEQSWLIETVNEEEWNHLRQGLRNSYDAALHCFAGIEDWNEDRVGEAVAILTHTAYHLGAIRQLVKIS